MRVYDNPLNIAIAFVVENDIVNDIAIGQLFAGSKSNEIQIVRELICLLSVEGATIVADALHCQEETVNEILNVGADYVLSVKKNQPNLHEDILRNDSV